MMEGWLFFLLLLPLFSTAEDKKSLQCFYFHLPYMQLTPEKREKALARPEVINCPEKSFGCSQNITHADNELWLMAGCARVPSECSKDCRRYSAFEGSYPSLYHFSCCCLDSKCSSPSILAFSSADAKMEKFLRETSQQALPPHDDPSSFYWNIGVSSFFVLIAIGVQALAVGLYRRPVKR